MRENEMRKPGLEPGQVTLLDPKSSSKPLTKANTRPSGTEQHRKSLSGSTTATISATQRRFWAESAECWEWA
jgi:hypothetical protein